MRLRIGAFCLGVLAAAAASASDRPFVFSVVPQREARAFAFADTGYADPGAAGFVSDGLEQRVGLQVRLAPRLTALAFAIVPVDSRPGSATAGRAELLYDVLGKTRRLGLSAGGGIQIEPGGTRVLIGRAVADLATQRLRASANVVIERPFGEKTTRDAVDALTSLGFGVRASERLDLGLELLAEDLEALWEAEEAEGGAKMMIGPSARYRLSGGAAFNVSGGPIFVLRETGRGSDALRALGASTRRGYVVRASLSLQF